MPEMPLMVEPGKEGAYPVNFFWADELEDGKSGLIGTPGLTLKLQLAASGELRGMHEDSDGYLWAVCGSYVYRHKSGTTTKCTGALLTSTGLVKIEDNGIQVMIIDSAYGYTVTGTVVSRVTSSGFPIPAALTYQDGYGILVEKDTGRFYISGLKDFTSWDPHDYTSSEGFPDDTRGIISDHRELLTFGDKSTETFYYSGAASFPFTRLDGGFIEKGTSAGWSPAKGDNTVFWLTDKRQVIRAAGIGGAPQVISTTQLEKRFQAFTTVSDAFGFCIDMFGTWYVLTFPSQGETWCYNAKTLRWHRWASFPYPASFGRHRANCYAFHAGEHLVGDFELGCIYKVDPSAYADNGEMIRSQLILPVVDKGGRWVYHNRTEIECKTGVGLDGDVQGSDPMIMMDWTDDRQRTWSNERTRSMGKIGEFGKTVVWNSLGRSKARQYRVTITDPVERQIFGWDLSSTVGGF